MRSRWPGGGAARACWEAGSPARGGEGRPCWRKNAGAVPYGGALQRRITTLPSYVMGSTPFKCPRVFCCQEGGSVRFWARRTRGQDWPGFGQVQQSKTFPACYAWHTKVTFCTRYIVKKGSKNGACSALKKIFCSAKSSNYKNSFKNVYVLCSLWYVLTFCGLADRRNGGLGVVKVLLPHGTASSSFSSSGADAGQQRLGLLGRVVAGVVSAATGVKNKKK